MPSGHPFYLTSKVKCQGDRVITCNVAIVVATNQLRIRSLESAAVRVEYSRNSIITLTISQVALYNRCSLQCVYCTFMQLIK